MRHSLRCQKCSKPLLFSLCAHFLQRQICASLARAGPACANAGEATGEFGRDDASRQAVPASTSGRGDGDNTGCDPPPKRARRLDFDQAC